MAMPRKDAAERMESDTPSTAGHTVMGLGRPDSPRVKRECRQSGASPTIGASERALWAAILSDAVAICLGRTSASASEAVAALSWIQEGSSAFSGFSWCCDLLRLDDSAIRERVTRGMWRLDPARRRSVAACSVEHVAAEPLPCGPSATVFEGAVLKQKRSLQASKPNRVTTRRRPS
jgi:hypothetical protein